MPIRHNQNIRLFSLAIFIVAIFIVDLYIDVDAVIPVLFVAPVLLTLFHKSNKVRIGVASICTLLTLISFYNSKWEEVNFLNFSISVIGIWLAFYFIQLFENSSQAESRVRERLNALFEYSTEGMMIASGKGEIVMINPTAEKQFGYDKGELIGKRIETLIPDRLSERHVKHRDKYSENPYPRPMGKGNLLFGKRKDGIEFPVEISLSNFTSGEGKFVIAFIIDISERREADLLLQKEKDLAQMYLDIAPVIFMVLSNNQEVILINQNGSQVLGYPESSIIGKNWFNEFVSDDQQKTVRESFHLLVEGTGIVTSRQEYEIKTASGEKHLIGWKYSIIRDEKGNAIAVLASGEDITEMRKNEKLIKKSNIELQQYSNEILQLNADLEKRVQKRTGELAELIDKLENTNEDLAVEIKERKQAELLLEKNKEELRIALDKEKVLSELKSRFVTMASHEFRTPLSTILSSASLISKYSDAEQNEKRIKHIERIKSSVYNLTSILNDFLSLGKLEEGKIQCTPSDFDIVSFSNDLVGEMKELTKTGQVINYKHHGTITKVVLDKNLTRNICINLLSNAIKYSAEGSTVEFETKVENNKLQILVSDIGIGIPENEQSHIFERFFRANNAANIAGTGLGLNIVKKYTELMSGEVTFKSIFEKGTTFTITLPSELSN